MTIPKEYRIRTLKDIFDLPTFDMMKRCLSELSSVMLVTRGTAEMLAGVAREVTKEEDKKLPDGLFHKWPDEVVWKDDHSGKSEIKMPWSDREGLTVEIDHEED